MNVNPPKAVNLVQLRSELATAGVTVAALGSSGSPVVEVHTYDASGAWADLPSAAAAVVAAHVAVDQVRQQRIADAATILNNASVMTDQATRDAMARTIGVKPLVIPLAQKAVSTDIVLIT